MMQPSPQQSLESLYRATRQLNAPADVHDAFARDFANVRAALLQALAPPPPEPPNKEA